MPRTINVSIKVECANEAEHLEVSTFLKTIMHILDQSIEGRNAGNDFKSQESGMHHEARTKMPDKAHPLHKALGLS